MENAEILTNQEIYTFIKRAVTEAIKEERFNLYLSLLPKASNDEMKDIMKQYGNPPSRNYEDYEDSLS